MTFAQELKEWRGERRQKEVCDIFDVSLKCFQSWEQGVNEPKELVLEQARWRMAADRQGVSISFYRAKYLSVIKKVAAEIMERK